MTVADIDRSVKFYTNVLTFEKQIEVERSGPKIDELYGVPNARIRAVELKLGNECIELLQFIGTTPSDGRPAPANGCATDISHYETVLLVENIAEVNAPSAGAKNPPLSVKQIAGSEVLFHASQAELIRDPDGHPLLLLQR
jgi:catechol 2,3-dioxygenase-like lactoylglutathione lyase family enzyme